MVQLGCVELFFLFVEIEGGYPCLLDSVKFFGISSEFAR